MISVKPPNKVPHVPNHLTIFLAGSIEMGKAKDWQAIIEKELDGLDCIVLNPRRGDWKQEWVQSIDHQEFTEQVTW